MENPATPNETSPSSVDLLSLPNELLDLICRSCCLHCRLPHVVDCSAGQLREGRLEQRGLAALCRSSKRLKAIAQPILFHYYHTGIDPNDVPAGSVESILNPPAKQNKEFRLMRSFARSLILRPDLANSVKAMSFFAADLVRESRGVQPQAVDIVEKGRMYARRLEILEHLMLNGTSWAITRDLVILTAPKLRQLLISSPIGGLEHYSRPLPNLQYVVLSGSTCQEVHYGKPRYSTEHFKALFDKAINLECLTSIDGFVECRPMCKFTALGHSPWEEEHCPTDAIARAATYLGGLKKLCYSSFWSKACGPLLERCRSLSDFEFHREGVFLELLPIRLLDPCRSRLRRLRITMSAQREAFYRPLWPGHDVQNIMASVEERVMQEEHADAPCFQFASFPVLEIIDIEQCALHDVDFWHLAYLKSDLYTRLHIEEQYPESARHLIPRLPRSLKCLVVRAVLEWSWILRDMLDLLRERNEFPGLTHIILEYIAEPPEPQVAELVSAFGDVGVLCQVARMVRNECDKKHMVLYRARLYAEGGETFCPEPQLELVDYS